MTAPTRAEPIPLTAGEAAIMRELLALRRQIAGIERYLESLSADAPGKYRGILTRHWRNRHDQD